jgi:hypothetical protein
MNLLQDARNESALQTPATGPELPTHFLMPYHRSLSRSSFGMTVAGRGSDSR